MGKLVPIVVKSMSRNGGNSKIFATPEVKYINEELMSVEPAYTSAGFTIVKEIHPDGTVFQYESYMKPDEIEVMRLPTTTDYALLGLKSVARAAVGTTNGTTSVLVFYNEYTAIGVGATEACITPTAVLNKCVMAINNDTDAILMIFPNSGGTIGGGATDVKFQLAIGARAFFVCTDAVAKTWVKATDRGR